MGYKILFLGPRNSPILVWLKKQNENVFSTEERITKEFVIENKFDFLISYGYRFIINKDILNLFPNTAINLHISLLPYNRGSDPNFWSFIDGTPKGVSIHYINEGVDTGDIIAQKEVSFGSLNQETLFTTYNKLQREIQKLFFQNWNSIKKQSNSRTPQEGASTYHKAKDKEGLLYLIESEGWNTKVSKLIKYYEGLKSSQT